MNEVQIVLGWEEAVEEARLRGYDLSAAEYVNRFELRDMQDENRLVAVGERMTDLLKTVAQRKRLRA
jgi:hypothetical protein